MRRSTTALSAVLLFAAAATLSAQNNRNVTQSGTATTAATRDPLTKRAMTIADYAKWRTIRDVALTDDGAWASYGYQQRWVDDTLFLKNLATNTEQQIARASRAQFSDDSKWVAYFVVEPVKPNDRSGSEEPRNGPARLELRNLATGGTIGWDNVASFAFSKGSAAMIVRKARAGAAPDAAAAGRGGVPAGGGRGGRGGAAPARVDGTDMIIRHMRDGIEELIGGVNGAEFNRNGRILAYTVSGAGRDGNGVFTVSTETWQRRALDSDRADYTRLTWDDSGSAVAALRGVDRRGFTERENALVAFTNVESAQPKSFIIDRKSAQGLADSMVISDKGTLSWSPDLSTVFIGLKPQEAAPAPRRDSTAVVDPVGNVDVWHWKDPVIQPVQMVRAQQDRNRTFLAAVHLAGKHVLPLADDKMDRVQVAKDGKWAIGQDDKAYVSDWMPQQNDIYRVSTSSGERTLVLKGQERTFGFSPDGRYFLYWKDKNVWAYDLAANKHVNITAKAPVSFVNAEEDHVGEKPAYGIAGYTKDGKSVILDHRYDEWLVSLDGSTAPRNLTDGVGAKSELRFRYVPLANEDNAPAGGGGFGGRGGGGGAQTIDLAKPILLSAFSEPDKKSGFYTLDGDKLTKLVYEDRSFGRPTKAKSSDRVLFTRETYVEYPDYWVTNGKFENPERLTLANPQQNEFKWGHRVLFSYKDKDGHPLQGTLVIPDDYKQGTKLPMFVNYYEKYSQNLNHYETPRYATAPQFADLVSNDYLVMQPDVYYHTGRSHTDMLNSVEAAVKKVIELGYVDPKRVCLQGHSYSGQGSAYIATQSKMFACVLAGAAAVDLVADFNQLWKTNGTNQARFDIYGQGRFGTNPYDNLELFMDQSAVFHVKTMNTPLLLVQGTNDGSTEWLQGVEFYNALRFNHKPVIFLSYEGEAHGFTRYDNQYDVMTRQHQFLDYYLKDAPAPDWIAKGIPFIKKKTPTGAAAQPVQLIGPGGGLGTPMTGGGAGAGAGGGTPPTP